MTTPTAETLERWKQAGVFVEQLISSGTWTVPHEITSGAAACCRLGSIFRPYRAPGHIQPHDGSAERPEWVAEDALVLPYFRGGPSTVAVRARDLNWSVTDYFIVLPRIKPDNIR
jgi:hypothetical protein